MAKTTKLPGQPTMTTPPDGPRLAVCRFPGVIHVVGRKPMTAGAEVNLDEVTGHRDGVAETLADALGPHLQHFELVRAANAPQPPVALVAPAEE